MHHRRLACALAALATLLLWVLSVDVHEASANNWPPANGADMSNPSTWPNDPDYPGLWEYFSWLPKQNGSAAGPYVGADVALGAAGMSVDVGWTYTIGRTDVLIGIIDNGIEWDDTQVVNKAYLSFGELAKYKPQDSGGNPCGGTGALAGYDCNGDGIFNVADYLSGPADRPDGHGHDRRLPSGAGPDAEGARSSAGRRESQLHPRCRRPHRTLLRRRRRRRQRLHRRHQRLGLSQERQQPVRRRPVRPRHRRGQLVGVAGQRRPGLDRRLPELSVLHVARRGGLHRRRCRRGQGRRLRDGQRREGHPGRDGRHRHAELHAGGGGLRLRARRHHRREHGRRGLAAPQPPRDVQPRAAGPRHRGRRRYRASRAAR